MHESFKKGVGVLTHIRPFLMSTCFWVSIVSMVAKEKLSTYCLCLFPPIKSL